MSDRDEPCTYGCGWWDHGDSLVQHEVEDHSTCPVCGAEPDDDGVQNLGVRWHKEGCSRQQETDQERRTRWAAYIAASRAEAR